MKRSNRKLNVFVARLCDYCGKEYMPKGNGSKFCSTYCRVRSWRGETFDSEHYERNKNLFPTCAYDGCNWIFAAYKNSIYCPRHEYGKENQCPF